MSSTALIWKKCNPKLSTKAKKYKNLENVKLLKSLHFWQIFAIIQRIPVCRKKKLVIYRLTLDPTTFEVSASIAANMQVVDGRGETLPNSIQVLLSSNTVAESKVMGLFKSYLL